ncbi:3-methyl-2-oxobutanoate hydroxymethyltransferase [Gemmobacter lanyuensis]
MAKRPTIHDLRTMRGKHQYAMLRVETLEEAEAAERAGVEMLSVPPSMILDPNFRDAAPTAFCFPGDNFFNIGGPEKMLEWALNMYKHGADAVYCSGSLAAVRLLSEHAIPVCGHVGLIPSKATWTGGFKAVGKTLESAQLVWNQCKALEEAGAFAVEIEVVPASVTDAIAEHSDLFLISMGAGSGVMPSICSPMTSWARTPAMCRAMPRSMRISRPNMPACKSCGSRPCAIT